MANIFAEIPDEITEAQVNDALKALGLDPARVAAIHLAESRLMVSLYSHPRADHDPRDTVITRRYFVYGTGGGWHEPDPF